MNLNFNDFQKQDIKFDVNKLQNAYKELLTIKGFSGVDGVSNFGAISLTQIPGDPDSIKGHKARGVFWTKPDSSGKEAMRDQLIDESAYSEFIEDYKLLVYGLLLFSVMRFSPGGLSAIFSKIFTRSLK